MTRRIAVARLSLLLVASIALAACGGQQSTPAPTTAAATTAPAASEPTAAPTEAQAEATTAPSTPAPEPTAAATATAQPSAPNAPAAPAFTRTLRLQEPRIEGDDVRQVQRRLLQLGYGQVGEADGIYGPATESAVRAFQERGGLETDGIVGPATWGALFGEQVAGDGEEVIGIVHAPSRFLLGGLRGGEWLDAQAATAALGGGERYRIVTAAAEVATATGEAPVSADVPCPDTQVVALAPEPPAEALIALGGDWDPFPRRTMIEPADSPELRDAVTRILSDAGIAAPEVRVTAALRVDIDGDGAEEVLATASRLAEPRYSIAAGDYSLALLLREGAPPLVLAAETHLEAAEFAAPLEYRIGGVMDLNGDGVLDVVIEWEYYEGAGTLVFDLSEQTGGEPRPVLETGCGA
jgi:hypothetical protein